MWSDQSVFFLAGIGTSISISFLSEGEQHSSTLPRPHAARRTRRTPPFYARSGRWTRCFAKLHDVLELARENGGRRRRLVLPEPSVNIG